MGSERNKLWADFGQTPLSGLFSSIVSIVFVTLFSLFTTGQLGI